MTRRSPLPLVTMLLGAVGCSVAPYDADYAEAVARHREAAPFAILQPAPTDFAAGRVAVRVPVDFSLVVPPAPPAEGQPPPVPLHTSRLRPDFLETLAGYQGTVEKRLAAENVELPVSVAVWALPAADRPRAALEKSILDKVRSDEAFKAGSVQWQDREVKPRDGGPATWRVLSLAGPQVFEGVVAGNPEVKRRDGSCELWLSADPVEDLRVMLVWRVPETLTGSLQVSPAEAAETVARTVTIRPPPAGGEPPAEAKSGPTTPTDPAADRKGDF